ncbi:MAG: FecR domain-containing protein [Gammaproteobacteria bacterium]|nr:FecR domain-containing protein [Gammaproteobacteria bacterium]
MPIILRSGAACVIACLLIIDHAQAQQPEWIYIVTEHDTLWNLSEKYFPNVHYWKKFKKLNSISHPKRIKPGTRLRVPLAWLSEQAVPAKIVAARGDVELISAKSSMNRDSLVGIAVHLGDRLQTGPSASAAVEFADGTIITLHPQTTMLFDHLSAYSDTGMVDSRLRLSNGRVEIRAKPAAGPGSRFEIHTPSAVSAVRGTEYRAATQDNGITSWIEVLEGAVAATGGDTTTLVPAEFGTRVVLGEPPVPPRPLLRAPRLNPIPEKIRRSNWPLTWQSLKGATHYQIEVSTEADFSLIDWESRSENTRTPLPDLADGQYFMRVRGIDELGIAGLNQVLAVEIDARPQPPAPLKPVDGALLRGTVPTLHWTRSAEASHYRLQLATDEHFEEPVIDRSGLSTVTYEPPDIKPTTYHWRLASISTSGEQGPFGPSRSFQVKPAPAQPRITLDAGENRVRASWQTGAEGQSYQVQIADDPQFNHLLLDKLIGTNQIEVSQVKGRVRYLRVRIVEADGYLGPWGAVQKIDPLPDRGWVAVLLSGLVVLLLL